VHLTWAYKYQTLCDILGRILIPAQEVFSMHKEVRDYLELRRKLIVLEFTREIGSVVKAYWEFEVTRSSFYRWKKIYEAERGEGLVREKPRSHISSGGHSVSW